MRKLSLDLDRLSVESFATARAPRGEGTVHGAAHDGLSWAVGPLEIGEVGEIGNTTQVVDVPDGPIASSRPITGYTCLSGGDICCA